MLAYKRIALRVILAGVVGLTWSASVTLAQGATLYNWSRSLPVDFQSPGVGVLGGTEARTLVAFDGKLFAGIGYWRDTQQNNPKLPGAQVLVLDAPNAAWKVDLQLDTVVPFAPGSGIKAGRRRYFAIGSMAAFAAHQDAAGKKLGRPVPFLVASVWDRVGGLRLFLRGAGAKAEWHSSDLAPTAPRMAQVRSFGTHVDAVTGREMFFAGASPGGVYSGTFDGSASFVRWNAEPETWDSVAGVRAQSRVMAFAECNGKLYATSGFQLFERQDGPSPAWRKIYTDPNPSDNPNASGYRGMTVIAAPDGGQELLFGVEAYPSRILRVDPRKRGADGMASAALDLDVSEFLTQTWGTRTTYALPGYNDMLQVRLPGTKCDSQLIGFEATTPSDLTGVGVNHKHAGAEYFVRRCDEGAADHRVYEVHRIDDPAHTGVALTATRAITASPFRGDPVGTVYASGLDAGNLIVHNSAWIYKGLPVKSMGTK